MQSNCTTTINSSNNNSYTNRLVKCKISFINNNNITINNNNNINSSISKITKR